MKVLVLATDYSRPDGYVSLHYIHSRNKWYVQKGLDVSVLSFAAEYDYQLDGVKVYTTETYKEKLRKYRYDILVVHAPNLRNHYRFLRKQSDLYDNIVFFFHGHEVVKTSKIYPKPYDFVKRRSVVSRMVSELYDCFKLKIWRQYFPKIAHKSQFVFVSNWMYDMFIKFVQIAPEVIVGRKHIIYNCVGDIFEKVSYNREIEKKYDFITIRNNLNGSKYAIDVVSKIALNNPKYSFCVVGKGDYFRFNEKPDNLTLIEEELTHEEIINYLNISKCALMPTRADSQGVMVCEMATFGIPVITSEINVCKEIFGTFNNVSYIDNEKTNIDIGMIYEELLNGYANEKNTKFFSNNTIGKEIDLFKHITRKK